MFARYFLGPLEHLAAYVKLNCPYLAFEYVIGRGCNLYDARASRRVTESSMKPLDGWEY